MNNPSPLPAPPAAPGRAEIVDWLAGLGERSSELERIDSMELAWLVHQVEQRYAIELSDEHLERIKTIDEAVAVLAEVIPAPVEVIPAVPPVPADAELESHG